MPIVEMTGSTLEVVCAACGESRRLKLDELTLGVALGGEAGAGEAQAGEAQAGEAEAGEAEAGEGGAAEAGEASAEPRINKDAIALPACPACCAVEHLLRVWADPAPGADSAVEAAPETPAAAHRRAVNRLAAMLKSRGRVHRACAEALAAEDGDPPDIHPETPHARQGRIRLGLPPWVETLKGRSR